MQWEDSKTASLRWMDIALTATTNSIDRILSLSLGNKQNGSASNVVSLSTTRSTNSTFDGPSSSSEAVLIGGSALVASSMLIVVFLQLATSYNPIGRSYTFWKQMTRQESKMTCADSVNKGIDDYDRLHSKDVATAERLGNYEKLVNAYYDLATVFYEWGWGNSFHFSSQYPWENFATSIRRHEYVLASQLTDCYGPTKHVLDVGCGIGGPARNIGHFLQCKITGLTLNHYQVQRGNELNASDSYSNVKCIQGDFMKLPFEPNTFDGAYAIEATCHAPNRVECYQQIYNVLKPGTTFACYEWCMTDLYDPTNPEHLRLKKDIEHGNGLPDICTTKDCLNAMRQAGFEIIAESDLVTDVVGNRIQSWMTPLLPSWNPFSQRFQFNPVGAVLTNVAIRGLEFVRLAPVGTVKTQKMLQTGGFALRDAGTAGIFTVMYLMVGRKPSS